MREIVLGSSSPYRRQLLEQLQLPFRCCSPNIDEKQLENETAQQLVIRLAEQKALKVAERYPNALIISSDQVASLNEEIITKPGDFDSAYLQLQKASGNCLTFYTSLCLYNSDSKHLQLDIVTTKVIFRHLNDEQIKNYLKKDQPYDCAGSFKMESLGIALFKQIITDDSSALVGLPLIKLTTMLANEGEDVLT